LAKPYSQSISTTFAPIKPLDPVTKMRSHGLAICSRLTYARQINFCDSTAPPVGLATEWQEKDGAPLNVKGYSVKSLKD
jgi:hypothetical protein